MNIEKTCQAAMQFSTTIVSPSSIVKERYVRIHDSLNIPEELHTKRAQQELIRCFGSGGERKWVLRKCSPYNSGTELQDQKVKMSDETIASKVF